MKKIFIIFSLLLLIISCGGSYIKEPNNDKIDTKKYGILIFSVTFKENGIQTNEMYLDFKGTKGGSKELRVDPGDDLLFVYVVKEGAYSFNYLFGTNNAPSTTKTAGTREEREIFTEKKWGIPTVVKAGEITYAGNFFIKDFFHTEGLNTKFYVKQETTLLSAEIIVRKRMADLTRARGKYPFINNYSIPVTISLFQEIEDTTMAFIKHVGNIKKDTNEGYGPYKWGDPIADVKKLLEENKRTVLVVSKTQLLDNTNEKSPIEFNFSKNNSNFLFTQAVVHNQLENFDKIFTQLTSKYGKFATNENNKFTWFTSYSKIILEKTESELLLTYKNVGGIKTKRTESIVK